MDKGHRIGDLDNASVPNLLKVAEVGAVDEFPKQQSEMETYSYTDASAEAADDNSDDNSDDESLSNTGEPLNYELQQGYRILKELMADSNKAVNWPFLDPVDGEALDSKDYYERIKNPMWLRKMESKFQNREYASITEFVIDFRLMLENCYRYNGPDHYISRRGQKFETMLEQKLALLSRELRAKTSIAATSGHMEEDVNMGLRRRTRAVVAHDSTALLNMLREEEAQRERESRRQQIQVRKAEKEAYLQELLEWEEKQLFQGKLKEQMKAMWEIPQISLFLFLCQTPLNLGEIPHFELERCFMMPRESSTMQQIMTSLLSTPFQRTKFNLKNLMPYNVWEEKLRTKMQPWYKLLEDSSGNMPEVAYKLGLDEKFFQVVGNRNPLEKKKYHQLSFYRRVWIIKGLCDHIVETQESLREMIESHALEDQRDYHLGMDADGYTYHHFPQFCGADLRIYRQAPIKYPKYEVNLAKEEMAKKRKNLVLNHQAAKKLKKKKRVIETPVLQPSRQRPSRLRQTIKAVVPLQLNVEQKSVNSSEEGDDEGEKDEEDGQSSNSNEEVDEETEDSHLSGAETLEDHLSHRSDSTIPYGDKSDTDSHASSSQNSSHESSPSRSRQSQNIGPYSSRKRVRLKLEFQNNSSVNSRDELDDESLHKHMSGEEIILSQETKDNSYLDDNSKFSKNNDGKKICDTSSNFEVNSREGVYFDGKELKFKTEPGFEFEANSNNNSALQNVSDAHRAFDWVDFKNVFSAKRTITPDVVSCKLNSQGNPGLMEQSSDSMNFQIDNNLLESGFLDLDKSADSGMDNHVTDEIKRTKDISDGGKFAVNVKEEASGTEFVSFVPNSMCKIIKCESMVTLCRDDVNHKSTVLDANNGSGRRITNAESNKHENLYSRISDDTEKSQVSNNFINIDEMRVKEEPLDFPTNSVVGLEHNYQLPLDRGNTSFFKYNHEDGDSIHENANQELESLSLPEVEFSHNGLILNRDMVSVESSLGCTKTVTLKKENVAKELLPRNQMNDKQEDDLEEQCSTQKDGKKEHNSDSWKKYDVKNEVEEEDDDEAEMVPDLREFELIVDSVERLRELTKRFEEPEPMVIKKGKKEQIIKPPPRKRCVVELHKRLSFLLTELEPWESKLVKATEKARAKMQKEYEEFQEEPEEKGWDLEEEEMEEENSGSSVENTETEEDEEEEEDGGSQEEGLVSKGDDSNMETDISSRGRIRKRRIIPNNVEDQIAPKKAKIIIKSEQNAESVNIPAILQSPENSQTPGKVILNCSNLLQTLKGVPITNMLGGHIVLTSQGGQTVLATINPEHASGLRLLQTSSVLSSQHIKGKTELSTSSTSSPLAGSNHLQSNSLLSSKHPTIQMLLSKTSPGQGVVRSMEQLSSTAAATKHGILSAKSLLGTANLQIRPKPPETVNPTAGVSSQTSQCTVQKTHLVLHSPPMQKAKNNFYMANVNSLPLSVLKQLMKTKGVKVQYGPNQQGVVFIPTSLFSSAHQSAASTVMTNQTTEPSTVSLSARGQAAIISPCLGGQTSGSISVISPQPTSSSCQLLTSTTATQLSGRTTNSSVGLNTSYILLPASSSVTVVNPIIRAVSSESSDELPEKSSLPGGLQCDRISGPSVSANPLASSTSTQILTTNALNSSGKQVPKVIRISSPGTSDGKLKDSPNSDGASVSNSTLTNADGSAPVVVTLYEKDLVKQPCKYATNLTVKHLLLKRRSFDDKEKTGTQQILSTSATTITGSLSTPTLISTHRPLLSPSTTVQSTCVLTTISPAKLNTLLMQTNAAGAKTIPPLIKLPSKAVLDSAVQAVVTSVNTSLPTANIKVPSPVTLPSMQPRRNVTKTIQSMKYPIPVTPKVESKSPFKPSAAGLEQSVGSGQVSLQTGGTLTTTRTLLPTSVGLLQVAQQPKNISTPQVQYSPQVLINSQGILQGVLTPQGLVVPQTPQLQMQGVTQPGAAQLLAQIGMQSMNTSNISSSPSGISLSSGSRSGQSPVRLLPNSLIPNSTNILQQSQLGTLKPSDVKTTSIIIPQVVNPSVYRQSMTGASVKCSKATTVPVSESSAKFPMSQRNTSDTLSAGKSIVKQENQTFEVMSQADAVTKGTGIKEVSGPVTSKTVCVKSQNSFGSNLGHNASVVYTNTKTMPVLSSSVANQQTVLALKSPHTSGGNTMIIPQQNVMQASVSPMVNIPQGFILQGSTTGIPLASPVLQPIPSVNLAAGYSQATMLQQPTVNLLQSPISPVPVLNQQILTAVQQMQSILHPSQQVASQEALMKPPPVTKVLIPPNLISAAQKDGQQVTTSVAQSNIKTEPQFAGTTCVVSDSKTLPIPSLLVQGQNTNHSPPVPIQTTASKLIKQLSNSSLQSKLNQSNVPAQSLPEVKPVLLSQQLNTVAVSSPAKITPSNLIAPKSGKLGSKAGQTFVLSSPQKTSVFSQNSLVTSPNKGPLIPLLTPTTVNFGSVIRNTSSTDKSVSSLGNISAPKQILLLPKNTVAKGISSPNMSSGDSIVSSSVINAQESGNTTVSSISVIDGTSSSFKTNLSIDDPKEKPQKITLFSIGGQLVTGQGVPVTLDNGVLKLMPKAKVQINNQTLTPKQIQETLAKIGKMTIPSFAGQKVKVNQVEGSEVSPAGITFSPGVGLFKNCVKTETNTFAQNANVLKDIEDSQNFKIVDSDTKPTLQSPLKTDHLAPHITQGNVANAAQKTFVQSNEVNPKGIISDVHGLKVLKQGDSAVVQSASKFIAGPSYFVQGNVPQPQSSATILMQGPGTGDGIAHLIQGTANIPQETPILLPAYTVSGNAKVGMDIIQKFSNKEQGMKKLGQNNNSLLPGGSKQSQYGNIVAQTTMVQNQPATDSSKEELGSVQTVETSAEGRSQQACIVSSGSNLPINSSQSVQYTNQVQSQMAHVQQKAKTAVMKLQSGVTEAVNSNPEATTVHPTHQGTTGTENIKQTPATKSSVAHSADAAFFTEFKHSGNVHFVLKPMISSTGYIVCPRITNISQCSKSLPDSSSSLTGTVFEKSTAQDKTLSNTHPMKTGESNTNHKQTLLAIKLPATTSNSTGFVQSTGSTSNQASSTESQPHIVDRETEDVLTIDLGKGNASNIEKSRSLLIPSIRRKSETIVQQTPIKETSAALNINSDVQEKNEQEAALNLLTLANQASNR
ncbi:hypothetical protein CHS0354_010374 [Potamilus streckersoni]|uniref:Bromo domain-containing protein n=1 Tax=Potamilus streckersoni TaxID=2493646 RepID=A0AAE0WBV6_9BIVA|nr:hypothetical protein CHS0354_010374 [Potamilus streckersoni]